MTDATPEQIVAFLTGANAMTDIVERLRKRYPELDIATDRMTEGWEAADEIERLRAVHREIMAECSGYTLSNDVANRVWDIACRALEPKI